MGKGKMTKEKAQKCLKALDAKGKQLSTKVESFIVTC